MSWWAASFLRRCAVSRASPQLSHFPESAVASASLPAGWPARGTPAPANGGASHSVDGALAALDRVLDVARSLPGSAALVAAASARAVRGAEAARDAPRGARALASADARAAPDGDWDAAGGFARARAAEVALARARFALVFAVKSGSSGADGTGAMGSGSGSAAASAAAATLPPAIAAATDLSRALIAASAIKDELSAVSGDDERAAAAALVPLALAHARAAALSVLVFSALGSAPATAVDARAALVNVIFARLPPGTPPPAQRRGTGIGATSPCPTQPTPTPVDEAFRLCENAAESAVDVIARVGGETQLGAWVIGIAACARASARRNVAVARLLEAAPAIVDAANAGAGGAEGNVSSSVAAAARATSLVSAAFSELSAAYDVVTAATARVDALAPPPPATETVTEGSGGALTDGLSPARRVAWDLRAQAAEILAARADTGALLALTTLWTMSAAHAQPRQTPPTALFPLSVADLETVAPVFERAGRDARDALRLSDALDAAVRARGAAFCDAASSAGDAAGGGGAAARSLRVLGLLALTDAHAVTAEGLLRGACAAVERAPAPAARATAGIADTLLAALLRQWEKRGGEAAAAEAAGDGAISGAARAWGGTFESAADAALVKTGDARADLLARCAVASAITTAHVGSWGLGLAQDAAGAAGPSSATLSDAQ